MLDIPILGRTRRTSSMGDPALSVLQMFLFHGGGFSFSLPVVHKYRIPFFVFRSIEGEKKKGDDKNDVKFRTTSCSMTIDIICM